MNKLTLAHLAPYLPYDLLCETKDTSKQVWTLGIENIKHALTWWMPLVIPLSESPARLLEEYSFTSIADFEEYVITRKVAAKVIDELVAGHFDVFGLIEQGLAIDKTTVKPLTK